MKNKTPFLPVSLLALSTLALGPLAASAAEEVIQKTFPAQAGAKLFMDVDRGSITVKPSTTDQINVEVRRKVEKVSDARAQEIFDNHTLTLEPADGGVRVTAELKDKSSAWASKAGTLQVSYVVTVPRQFDVDLRTRGGSIQLGDLTGQAKVRTSAGSLKLGKINGPVDGHTSGGSISLANAATARLNTSAGNIDVDTVAGELTASTSGGSIRVQKAGASVSARTSAGSIRVGEIAGDAALHTSGGSIKAGRVQGKLDAETSAGSIDVDQAVGPVNAVTRGGSIQAGLRGQPKGDCTFKTSAGSIKLTAPENIAVDLDAHTSAGSISSDLAFTMKGKQTRSSLVGKINGGGPRLVLHTSGGSVTIKKSGVQLEAAERP